MLCEPDVRTTQVSQLLHGHVAEVVERAGLWLHVDGADGYRGWVHQGYVVTMPEPVPPLSETGWDDPRPLSLGCTVRDEHGATRKLPLGALITEGQERFGGLAMTLEERRKSFPPAADSITSREHPMSGAESRRGAAIARGSYRAPFSCTACACHAMPGCRL
jgi:hypothetical protein